MMYLAGEHAVKHTVHLFHLHLHEFDFFPFFLVFIWFGCLMLWLFLISNLRLIPMRYFKTYLQMQEAPFEGSRTGSEEDMLEYEEPVINCDACVRKRKCTLGEKVLLVVAAVCVIIIIALAVAVGNSNKDQNCKWRNEVIEMIRHVNHANHFQATCNQTESSLRQRNST